MTEILGSVHRHSQWNQTLPPHHHQGKETTVKKGIFMIWYLTKPHTYTSPLPQAFHRWGRPAPTSPQPWCMKHPWGLLVQGTLVYHKRCLFVFHTTCALYIIQNQQSSRTHPCPATGCPAWGLCIDSKNLTGNCVTFVKYRIMKENPTVIK